MIQRIQTVFLFLLAAALVSLLFLPLWSKADATTSEEVVLTAWNINSFMPADAVEGTPVKSSMAIGLLAIAGAVIALYEIFQYKNRLTQMKLGLLNTLVLAALLITAYYYAEFVAGPMVEAKEGNFEAGFYMPVLALLLNALANRFIRRDENLVRSVDRLR
jgi:hypothetical protein